ncbi:PRD domain protein (TIGR03582 family) [Enterococcus sp. PF1-24]|uniref:PRD domain-containing protein n=1 Tax=unclassified Enterococcus TaxID=2608891 RepID=UPI00247425C9|nr:MULTISPECIES: PRD domain-containing protein [unclassified Enterococcus]MDH6363217.1 PRD domain protein (TIGR03582 family) [Enterococcus sp. PFB1-1]MDH6400482.1 PRD domain protein (TIGR03582 family) [Enterococcus sp. PF1-24]
MEHLSADAKKIVEESPHASQLTEVVVFTKAALDELAIQPTELQWTILVNHLNEMIKRWLNKEELQNVDISLFTEVSAESIALAERIAEKIGGMPKEEAYVLSIHFESAKMN